VVLSDLILSATATATCSALEAPGLAKRTAVGAQPPGRIVGAGRGNGGASSAKKKERQQL